MKLRVFKFSIISLFFSIFFSNTIYAVELDIIDSLSLQRDDGSGFFDIYYNVSHLDNPIEISVIAITNENDTVFLSSIVEPSDIGIIRKDGLKHVTWDMKKDINSLGIIEYFEFVINAEIAKETLPYKKPCIYITNSRSDDIIRIDNIFGENYTVFNSNIVGGLNSATDISTDKDGRIYITDSYNRRIVRMDNMNGFGSVSLGKSKDSDDKFGIICGVIVDNQDRIYVTDYENSRIVRVDNMNGDGWISFGEYGSEDHQFNRPHGIALDTLNRIYIADTHNHRIVRINDMTGDGWVSFGSHGNDSYQFIKPTGIQVDINNRIYISDRGNFRVVRLEGLDGSGWETCYAGTKALYNLDVDDDNNVYITDILKNRIIMIEDMNPNSLIYFSTNMNRPYGIHISK